MNGKDVKLSVLNNNQTVKDLSARTATVPHVVRLRLCILNITGDLLAN